MPIVVNLDLMMARRKMSLNELAGKVDITFANLSILRREKPRPYDLVGSRKSARLLIVSRGSCWIFFRRIKAPKSRITMAKIKHR